MSASYDSRHDNGEQYASEVTAGRSSHIETRTTREALKAATSILIKACI